MSFEQNAFPTNDFERLRIHNILEAGYGKRFDHSRTELLFRRASDIVETKDHLGATAGLAIIGDQENDNARIMMACGFRDADEKARDRYKELIRICRDEQLANWMSVGIQYDNVQALCSAVGFDCLDDAARARELVGHLHAPLEPIVAYDASGSVVIRGKLNPSGLGQYIFAHTE